MIWVPESPRYLVSSGKLEQAKTAFETIAAWNKRDLVWNPARFTTHNQSKAGSFIDPDLSENSKDLVLSNVLEKPSTGHYLRQPKLLVNLIIMSLVWLSTSFCYYLILMLTNTFDDVYVTGMTNGATEIIAYFISGIVY